MKHAQILAAVFAVNKVYLCLKYAINTLFNIIVKQPIQAVSYAQACITILISLNTSASSYKNPYVFVINSEHIPP